MKAEFHFEGEPVAFAVVKPATIPATKQDICDRVVRHYRKQPRRCTLNGQCQYWVDGDERCFVGALMSESDARAMPSITIESAIADGRAPRWMGKHKDFLVSLQDLHDTKSNWDEGRMPMVLEMFAAAHGLVIPA